MKGCRSVIGVRILYVCTLMFTVASSGCNDDASVAVSEGAHKTVLIAVNMEGEIFLSGKSAAITMNELSSGVGHLVDSEDDYVFVIQSDGAGTYAKEVKKTLLNQGVEKHQVVIARSRH